MSVAFGIVPLCLPQLQVPITRLAICCRFSRGLQTVKALDWELAVQIQDFPKRRKHPPNIIIEAKTMTWEYL
jgi:hypothetical protein